MTLDVGGAQSLSQNDIDPEHCQDMEHSFHARRFRLCLKLGIGLLGDAQTARHRSLRESRSLAKADEERSQLARGFDGIVHVRSRLIDKNRP